MQRVRAVLRRGGYRQPRPEAHGGQGTRGAFVTGRIEYWTCRTCGKYFADAGGAKEISRDDIIIPRLGAAADSEGGKASPATFDAGIGVSAVTAVTSLAGLALLRRKRRDGE